MSDEVSRILMESQSGAAPELEVPPIVSEEDFNEAYYLQRNPDVANCVAQGLFPTGYAHYKQFGRFESRVSNPLDADSHDKIILATENFLPDISNAPLDRLNIDGLLVSPSGGIMVIGWADDSADAIDHIIIGCARWKITISASSLIRIRRQDAEEALGAGIAHSYGFFGLHFEEITISVPQTCNVTIVTMSGRRAYLEVAPANHSDSSLRDVALSYLAGAKFYANYQLEAISKVSRGFGKQVVALNRFITNRFVANPYVERFGSSSKPLKGSIVVCLYGRAEYLFLQSALFTRLPGIDDYEFIYVSNSPELAETLLREAKMAARIYNLRITIVLLEGNAGFGAANNAAAKAAQSHRILTVNPDVFPQDASWASKHTALIEGRPKSETQIFGVPLYYDDGSLMHGGMFFELDTGVILQKGTVEKLQLVRVEHYGKGAPTSISKFTDSRRIPAVTGAFISSDRAWYEKLGGFTEDYVFGHYEDADLCLKSTVQGTMPWMHDLRLWHLEGKGSTRLHVHEGGSLINRWLFSSRWAGLIQDALLGPNADLDRLEMIVAEGQAKSEIELAQKAEAATPVSVMDEVPFPNVDYLGTKLPDDVGADAPGKRSDNQQIVRPVPKRSTAPKKSSTR